MFNEDRPERNISEGSAPRGNTAGGAYYGGGYREMNIPDYSEAAERFVADPGGQERIDTAYAGSAGRHLASRSQKSPSTPQRSSSSGKKTSSGRKSKKNSTLPQGKLVLAGVAAAAAVCLILLTWAVKGYRNIYPGVYVGNVNVGRHTAEEACELIKDGTKETYQSDKYIPLVINENEYKVTVSDAGVAIDARSAADDAYEYGRTGGFFKRAGKVIGAFFGHKTVIDSATVLDERSLHTRVREIAEQAEQGSSDAGYEMRDGIVYLDAGSVGIHVDENELYEMLSERFIEGDFSALGYQPVVKEPDALDVERILESLSREKKNAYLDLENDPSGKTIAEGQDGISFDIPAAIAAFERRDGRYVEIEPIIEHPDITKDKLKTMLFRDVLSQATTTLNTGLVGRTANVRLAVNAVNGTVLNPGDEFSYNKVVGPRTEERGFKDAKIFVQGEVVDGIGGGICQVSSTLYMATLYADLKVSERRNHRFAVSYTPLGQDATVAYGSTDYRFINNTDYPIRVEASLNGSKVNVRLIGTKTDKKTVKLSTTVLEKIPYEKVTKEDPTLAYGKKKVDTSGYTGYKTVTYRVYYDENGNETKRVEENRSNYTKLDELTLIGTMGKPADADQPGENVPTSGDTPSIPETPSDPPSQPDEPDTPQVPSDDPLIPILPSDENAD